MSATGVQITAPPTAAVPEHERDASGNQAVRNVVVMARRNLIHIAREPMQMSDVTIQPVLFTLLFVYVFGAGIALPGGGNYKDFVIPGLMLLNLTTSTTGTAVGLCTDIHTGAIDRFRTLPLWRPSILVGRSLCDLLSSTLCLTIVTLTGLAVGWRPHAGLLSVIGGLGIGLLFSYAMAWAVGCIGLISNAMVATQRMPAVLRFIANWNPVSAVTAGLRVMFGDPNPSAAVHVWPMQHPVAASLAWSFVILAVAVPTAATLFRSRTTG